VLVLLICAESGGASASADVDMLCECALNTALEQMQNGVTVFIGGSGIGAESVHCADTEDMSKILSLPFAYSASAGSQLPQLHDEKRILILALPPQAGAGALATNKTLDSFLNKKPVSQKIDIVFLYKNEKYIGAASGAAIQYSRLEGVYAKAVKL
jgi:hypothetical protein